MVLFKSCPKCETGDLMKSEDMFGEYVECLQCGFVKDLSNASATTPVEPQSTGDTERMSA